MKKVTKSREFDPVKENQPIESEYQKSEKHSLIKSFTQKADQNIEVSEENLEGSDIEKSKEEDYVEKPMSDVKGAKGKYVKVKKSFGKVSQVEKGGPKKFPAERPKANVPKREMKVAKNEEKASSCGMKYQKMMDYMKKKSVEAGMSDSAIMKSLDSIDGNKLTEEQFSVFEKACVAMDVDSLLSWIDLMVGMGANVTLVDLTEKSEEGTEEGVENIEQEKKDSKFKSVVKQIKQKSEEEGITDNPILKSLDEISEDQVTDEEAVKLEDIVKSQDFEALAEWLLSKKYKETTEETEKSLSSARGSGGDLIAPQIAGQKKRLVKVKKSVDPKSFFAQSDCQQA